MSYKENYHLIDWSKPLPVERKTHGPVARSSLPCPRIMGDTMDAVQSQLDGKLYDSKSTLRRTYRDAGVIEVGNDPGRFREPIKHVPDRKGIRKALEQAKSRLG